MEKKKVFNVTGLCIPKLHYMVDVSDKVEYIVHEYIEQDAYFTINRARQYGKTTMLELLYNRLKKDYIVLDISFESADDCFVSMHSLALGFINKVYDALLLNDVPQTLLDLWEKPVSQELPLDGLSRKITELCKKSEREVILMVDEVDRAADNQLFLMFLGLLRTKYLRRSTGRDYTFKSVILAGVHDIKNLKMKLRPEENHNYNSPWNIAAVFDVDMTFSADEIATMLVEYEQDNKTGMDIKNMSAEIFYYTGGYPFLVSCLCKKMDDEHRDWTCEDLRLSVRDILRENNTLFDDVIKNIKNNKDFSALIERIIVSGAQVMYEIRNPLIDLGVMYGILKEQDGKAVVSNIIFETVILNYYTSVRATNALMSTEYADRSIYIHDGRLDMRTVLQRFSAFMKSEYRDEDGSFVERQGRLLFLSFLRPIINSVGHYAVEPQTRQNTRMDIQVFYGSEEFIVELKKWHGPKREMAAYDQLTGYLDARGVHKGYLLSFCDNLSAPYGERSFVHKDHEIFEIIIAYRERGEV